MISSSRTYFVKRPLPPNAARNRTNLAFTPYRYDNNLYSSLAVYYWKYAYDGTQTNHFSRNCLKRPGQKYWAITYASGEKRLNHAFDVTKPSCLKHGFDEVIVYIPDDLDPEYKLRNAMSFNQTTGAVLWIWKHIVQYKTTFRMAENNLLFYMDSDMACTEHTLEFLCLANYYDVVPFHHSDTWYTLSRLASGDSIILMDMDNREVSQSDQFSGGNITFQKTHLSVSFVREMASWSQQFR